MLRSLSSRSPLPSRSSSMEAESPLSPITPPPTSSPATLPVLSSLGDRYKPTPLPSPRFNCRKELAEGGGHQQAPSSPPPPPPEPHPHPHPEPDPRPATPATPPERDEQDGTDEEGEVDDDLDSSLHTEEAVPSLVSTRHMSVSSSSTSTSFSSATKAKDGFIEDVSTLLSSTTLETAPAVFSDDDDESFTADDEDRPWTHGRNEAERRYSNEMRQYVLGQVEQLVRSGRESAAGKKKKRGSIRGRESSVIFET